MLKGSDRPQTANELLGVAGVLAARGHHDDAIRFYNEAFAADPKLADDTEAGHRSAAARWLVRETALKGKASTRLDPEARARYRRQALEWLKADLKLHDMAINHMAPRFVLEAHRTLLSWRSNADFSDVREASRLPKLAEAERLDWEAFWADVARLITIASKAKLNGRVLKPHDADTYFYLAYDLESRGDRANAIVEYRKSILTNPDLSGTHNNLASNLAALGKTEEAIAEYREAMRLDGNRLNFAIWNLGDKLLDLERYEEARAIYRQAREIGRSNSADVARADKKIESVDRRKGLIGRIDAVARGEDKPRGFHRVPGVSTHVQ